MPQKTWVVGEEVLAADMNAYVQQQVVATFATTAARDAWAGPPNGALCVTLDTNTTWQRIGGAWRPLGLGAYPSFRVIGGGAGQGVAPNVATSCVWQTEASDPFGVIAAGIFTCPTTYPGRWQFEWSVRFPGPSTGNRNVFLNVGASRYGQVNIQQSATGDTILAGAASVVLAAAATASVQVFHNHSGGFSINASADDHFQGYYVGPN